MGKEKTETTATHLLGVRVSPSTMKRLAAHCKKQSKARGRKVSYREVIESLITSLR